MLTIPPRTIVLTISSLALISCLSCLGSLWFIYQSTPPSSPSTIKIKRTAPMVSTITIDIQGAVNQPGVYDIPQNSRLLQALMRAKGLSITADRYTIAKNFNLAKPLNDGEKIYLPFNNETAVSTDVGALVNINSASQTQLELLPNIGPVTAQKIIDRRPYSSLDDLINRRVLGEKTLDKISQLLTL